MNPEEKYINIYNQMDEMIAEGSEKELFAALGYTSNLDILCDFQTEILNELLAEHLKDADLCMMRAAKEITCMKEFLETIVFFCLKGIGGEVDITDFEMIKNAFPETNGMGGTAVQGAMALAAVGCQSLVHLTDDSKEVCSQLESPYIYTVSAGGELIHTDQVKQSAEQEIHYIMQFKKGDVIALGEQTISIPASNRLIITKITVNATVPFSKPYFAYIEDHAKHIGSNVLSSFNVVQDIAILKERLEQSEKHIMQYKKNNEKGIVYFEDAHYHSREIRRLCMETLYPYVDIVSMNEEELHYTFQTYGINCDMEDILSCVRGIEQMRDQFSVKKGIIVHTKDYAMYVGDRIEADIEAGLMLGNLLAGAKALYGKYGTKEQIGEVMRLPLSPKGCRSRNILIENGLDDRVLLIPSKYIDKPRYTIGLGDSFTAGLQICFNCS